MNSKCFAPVGVCLSVGKYLKRYLLMLKVQTPYRRLMSVVCLYPIMILLDKLTG